MYQSPRLAAISSINSMYGYGPLTLGQATTNVQVNVNAAANVNAAVNAAAVANVAAGVNAAVGANAVAVALVISHYSPLSAAEHARTVRAKFRRYKAKHLARRHGVPI